MFEGTAAAGRTVLPENRKRKRCKDAKPAPGFQHQRGKSQDKSVHGRPSDKTAGIRQVA
jgi:hypothetical protein